MIVILAMLVLSLMQAVFLYLKLGNQLAAKHRALYQLEAVANKFVLMKHGRLSSDCIMTETDPNQMVDLLLHNQGCSLINNNRQYYYLIDNLGPYPCLQMKVGERIYSSHHWLISVATAAPNQVILQIRVAKPIRAIDCEHKDAHLINGGVISWRHLVIHGDIYLPH